MVQVFAGSGRAASFCHESRCDELDTEVDDATLRLLWQELEPEEDPVIVWVTLRRADSFAMSGSPASTSPATRVTSTSRSASRTAVRVVEDERLVP